MTKRPTRTTRDSLAGDSTLAKALGDAQLARAIAAQIPPPHATTLTSALAWISENASWYDVLCWPRIGPKRWRRIESLLRERGLTFVDGMIEQMPPPVEQTSPPVRRGNEQVAQERTMDHGQDAWRRELSEYRRQLDEIKMANADLEVSIARINIAADGATISCVRCNAAILPKMVVERGENGMEVASSEEVATASYRLASNLIGLANGVCPDCNPVMPRLTCRNCGARLTSGSIEEMAAAMSTLHTLSAGHDERYRAVEGWITEAVSGCCASCSNSAAD